MKSRPPNADQVAFLRDRRILLEFPYALPAALRRPPFHTKFSVNARLAYGSGGDVRITAAVHQLKAQRAVYFEGAIECALSCRTHSAACERGRGHGSDCDPREFVSFRHLRNWQQLFRFGARSADSSCQLLLLNDTKIRNRKFKAPDALGRKNT
jgi:hypothetical protein